MQISHARSGARILGLALARARHRGSDGTGGQAIEAIEGRSRPAAGHQRLPRQPRAAHRQRRSHHGGSRRYGRPRGRRRLPRQPAAHAAPAEPQHPDRLGRRPDRRQPAAVGTVPRRADDRGHERDGPRPQRRRQPRVRRGRHGAPAHAERRLRPRQQLPQRDLRRSRLRVPGGERGLQGHGRADLPALRHQEVRQHQGRLHRDDPRGDPEHRLRVRDPGRGLPRRGGYREQVRGRAPQRARRARDRRAAARGRHPVPVRGHRLLQRGRPDHRHRRPHERRRRPLRDGPHAPAVRLLGGQQQPDRRPPGHERELVRPAGHQHRVHARPQDEGHQGRHGRQHDCHAHPDAGRGHPAADRPLQHAGGPDREPAGRPDLGHHQPRERPVG